MRRELLVAFALLASVLVATVPAVGTHTLATPSKHTTDTDFSSAATLDNMTVVGSGTASNVEAQTNYSIVIDSGDGTAENDRALVGDRSDNLVLEREFRAITNFKGDVDEITVDIGAVGGSDYGFVVDIYAVQEVPDGVVGEGTLIKDDWDPDFTTGEQAIPLDTNFSVSKNQNWTIEFVTQSTDNDGVNDQIQIKTDEDSDMPVDDNWATTESDTTHDWGGDIELMYTPGTATYISQNHTAEDTEQGFVNITEITNASATVTWETNDGSGWSTLNETTSITTVANHTFTWPVEVNDTVRVNVTVFNQSGNGAPAFTLADEGIQFTASDTVVDNSSATPTGDLSTATPTLTIDVNDTDFGLSQGDSVDVEFFVDGSSEGTDTLTSNGTASQTVSVLSGGDHTWHVVANDSYGHSVTSQTFDISTPANITIRNESDPHGVIDAVTVEAIIAGTGETVDVQNTTDGNISMVGLPTDEEYIFVLEADGFHTRTVIVEDVFAQDDVFMLNTSLTSIENTFVLDDQTGQFEGDNVTLIIQRPINRSVYDSSAPEEFQWTDVAGDRTGAAEEFTVDLEKEKRFRIIVDNNEGDRRVLGEYQAETAGSVTLNIGELTFDVGADGATYEYDASFTSSDIKFNYTDPDDTTSSLTVKIFESGNASNEIYNQTYTDLGTLSVTQALSGDEENDTWVVEFSGTRDGESIAGSVVVGASDLSPGVPLDDTWKARIAFSLLLVLTGLTAGGINAETGTVVAALVGGVLWWSGWLPAEIGGGVVALALFVAAALTLSTRGGEEIQ